MTVTDRGDRFHARGNGAELAGSHREPMPSAGSHVDCAGWVSTV